MTAVRRGSLADAIDLAARQATDVPTLAAAVWTAVAKVVPFDFACLATIDPSTGLINGAYKSRSLDVGDEEWAALEYGGPDVNLFADLERLAQPVGVLSIDTGGRPENCRRHREFLHPRFGFTDELRVVFRSVGLTWGALALSRGPGDPPFTESDASTLAAVSDQVALLLRAAVFDGSRGGGASVAGPSVIVVDAADRVVDITDPAKARIDDLGGWDHGSLPAVVLAVTSTARATPARASTRAVGLSGTWLAIRAARFGTRGASDVVVTIEVASAADISALALAARGLSIREQEVAGLVLQGADTKSIAAALHLSPHTVQDHLKSIFAKLGVNSRRELVQRLVLT